MNIKKSKLHKIDDLCISKETKILEAIKILNAKAQQILFIVEKSGELFGTLTDGDIRRAILSSKDLKKPVKEICNKEPKYVFEDSVNEAVNLMQKYSVSRIPVLNNNYEPIGMLKLEDIIEKPQKTVTTPVVIMAGGKGTRLQPITKIIPKALVPVQGKPIIEKIINIFNNQGFSRFYLSINYKKEFIKSYFDEIKNKIDYELRYIEELDYYGTAGSLRELKGILRGSFILSYCDILVNTNYEKVIDFHNTKGFDLTIISALEKINVPYGVINLRDGSFDAIDEKPTMHILVNTGVYVIEPKLLNLIPKNEKFDMTDLINSAKEKGMKIGAYPVHNEWIDIGNIELLGNVIGGKF